MSQKPANADGPLRERVVTEIRESILSGRAAPGSVLPETDLAEQLGVSRGPVRDALAVLEREGLVVSQRNRRARVATLDLRDVEEIYSLRRSLETLAAQRAAVNVSAVELKEMRQILRQMARARDRRDHVTLSRLDTSFHDCVYRASRHDRLIRSWTDLSSQVVLFLVSRNVNAVTSHTIVEDHQVLLDALAERDVERLVTLTEQHLLSAYERLRDALIVSTVRV